MNDQQRAAMQMALEALEANMQDERAGQWRQMDDACTALREALAQPQGEWVDLTDDDRQELELFWRSHKSDKVNVTQIVCDSVIAKFKEKNTPPVVPQGEPVAWLLICDGRDIELIRCIETVKNLKLLDGEKLMALYTTPPSVEAAIEATKEKAAKKIEWYIGMNQEWFELTPQELAAAIRGMK